ncbi:MAG: hypothetical protein ABIF77_04695 [bacterium]
MRATGIISRTTLLLTLLSFLLGGCGDDTSPPSSGLSSGDDLTSQLEARLLTAADEVELPLSDIAGATLSLTWDSTAAGSHDHIRVDVIRDRKGGQLFSTQFLARSSPQQTRGAIALTLPSDLPQQQLYLVFSLISRDQTAARGRVTLASVRLKRAVRPIDTE